jgi:hypothetical protein
MKRILMTLLIAVVFVGGCTAGKAGSKCSSGNKPAKVLRHVVMLDFKEGISQAKINELAVEFASLPSKIDTIYDFEWGIDITDGRKNQGHTHFFVLSFRDQAGLAAYRPHPAHQAFVANLKPNLDKVLVLDYWAAP